MEQYVVNPETGRNIKVNGSTYEKLRSKHKLDKVPRKTSLSSSHSRPQLGERFANKIVFITGGTSGIGQCIAKHFANEGAAHIVVCGRTHKKWEQAQLYFKNHTSRWHVIEYWPCDVRIEKQVRDCIAEVYKRWGRLDVCINNAGVQPVWDGDITEFEFESYQEKDGSIIFRLPPPGKCKSSQTTPISSVCESPIATTAFGVLNCLKWEIWHARQFQPKDLPMAIVNTASRMGVLPDAHRPIYAASKAFILSLTRTVSGQVAKQNIRVNAVSPGPVDTPLERAAFPQWPGTASKGVPMDRVAQPEEIAPAYLFLSDSMTSSYITGSNFSVDGGFVAGPILS